MEEAHTLARTGRWSNAVAAALLIFSLGSCRDIEPLAPDATGPDFAISDAAHDGAFPGFYFRPPMVPDVPLPGTFDPTLAPEVTVCEWNGGCAATIVHFTTTSGPGSERVRANGDHYHVNWHAKDYDLDRLKTYRILVSVGGTQLGFADVDVVRNGSELKNVDTGEYIPLVENRTLPIKFYIQRGTVAGLGPDGGSFVSADGNVVITAPAGLLAGPLGITALSAPLDPGEYTDLGLVPGTTYDFGPDGTVFDEPGLSVTIRFDPANLGGIAPEDLVLATQVDGLWADVGSSVVDVSAGTVTANLSHFTLVTVAGIGDPSIAGPNPLNMVVGQMIDLQGTVRWHRMARWTSSAPAVVSIGTPIGPLSGRITALTPGTSNVCLNTEDPGLPWVLIARQFCITVNVSALGNGILRNLTGGFNFTCGQDASDVAYCWGQNAFGQLGDRTTTNRSTPVPVSGNLQFTKLVAGGAHACALTSDGTAWCWGRNNFGQLGDGTLVDRSAPVTVMGNWRFDQITVGDRHTCGYTKITPTSSLPSLLCWGSNEWGQSGGAIGGAAQKVPFTLTVNPAGGVTSLDAGLGHTCAIIGGRATCWGFNSNGQLGDGTTANATFAFNRVVSPETFKSISAGPAHTCAINSMDQAFCWGRNTVPGLPAPAGGMLGDGLNVDRPLPGPVSSVETWKQVDAGGNAGVTCGITLPTSPTPDKLYCWGRNLAGSVGDSTTVDRNTPTLVFEVPGRTFEQVTTTGGGHVCATQTGGGGFCWGSNAFGQVGDNTLVNKTIPVPVSAFTVAAGKLPGTIAGIVRRRFPNLPLHTVMVSPTYGLPAVTDAQGVFALGPMIPGPTTLKLDFMPFGCIDPGINTTVLSGQAANLLLIIDCAEIGSVTIAPAAATLQVGTILTPVVTIRDIFGNSVPGTPAFGATAPITVTPTGQISSQFVGSGTVTAAAGSVFGQSTITVQGGCPSAPTAGCVLTAHAPALEPYLRSVGSPAATTIEFTNASTASIQIFWLNFAGARQLFATVTPGATFGVSTFTTHTWAVTDMAGNAFGIYVNPVTTLSKVIHTGTPLASYTPVPGSPFGYPFSSVWGSSPTDVWAFGFGADPFHYTGGSWSVVGTGANLRRPMNDVWGSAANDVYAVGWNGRIIRYNGTSWSDSLPVVPDVFLNGVHGAGGSVYAVGSAGTILRSTDSGASWVQMPGTPPVQLQDIWLSDADNGWAVGDGGVIVRLVGGVWQTPETLVPDPGVKSFRGVWGVSASEVYAVGQGGMIYRWNGVSWTAETSNTPQTLQAVSGTSSSNVVAVGGQGIYIRRTAAGWVPQPVPSADPLEGIWFASPTDAVLVSAIQSTPQTGAILRGTP
jgi:alpha-tubulin suppressor-like RCC1 family protein